MFENYIKTAFRNLRRSVVYSLINISGLAIGMACCIITMLFVQDELSWDRFHENADQIFRITSKYSFQGEERPYAETKVELSDNIDEEIPEVQNSVRVILHYNVVQYQDKKFNANLAYADPSIFEVFTFPLIKGNKRNVLNDPDGAVISENLAERFFSEEDPMGKIISIYSQSKKLDMHITGIMKDIPHNSHFWFEFVAPLKHLEKRYEGHRDQLSLCGAYVLLSDKNSYKNVEEKINTTSIKRLDEEYALKNKYSLQPLTDIHLKSDMALELGDNSNISYSYYYSAIAIVIILIASVNFMNLSTARASRRAKEVGVRKVVGAGKMQLIYQFIGESMILAFIALGIAIIIAYFLIPFFNTLLERHLKLDLLGNPFLFISLFVLALFVGLLSGSYPAFFLSAFRPVQVIKGEKKKASFFSIFIRKGLVVFQFSASLVFIIATIVVFYQLRYVSKKDLGFRKDNIIRIPIWNDDNLCKKGDLIVHEFSKHPNILKVIVTRSSSPGSYPGFPLKYIPEGFDENNPVIMNYIPVGPEFFKFFGIEMVQGRTFSKEIQSDAESAVIINETAAKTIGWDFPIGKQIKGHRLPENTAIIGVVKDYHQGSLHHKIEPMIYTFATDDLGAIFLRIKPEKKQETIKFIENVWEKLPTYLPFNYSFCDEEINEYTYAKDRQSGKIFTFSASLAILLACLGLFGLAAFTAEQRIKEIGIRKILGASVSEILTLLSKDFAKLVLFANIIAWPITYYIMRKWLQNFAYKVNLNIWIFLSAGMLVLLITLITICSQSIKAATSNPVDTLRYE